MSQLMSQTTNFNLLGASLWVAAPEIFLFSMILIIMLLDAFFNQHSWIKKNSAYFLSQLSLIICFIFNLKQMTCAITWVTGWGQFILNPSSCFLKLGLYLLAFLTFWYAKNYNQQVKINATEFHLLALLSVLGGMVLISANSLLTIYLGLELLSLPLYALVAIARRRSEGSEAGLKYFIMGAIASGLLLYGMSLIYGVSGSLDLTNIASTSRATNHLDSAVFIVGLILTLIAIGFKLGAVPFHLWAPDVYEGAPTSVTLLIATVPKIAAFGMLIRLILDGMPHWSFAWEDVFNFLGVLSVFVGNFIALLQNNLKRLLAYSTIGNMGFVLIALGLGESLGSAPALFYLLIYTVTTAGVLGGVLLLSKAGLEIEKIEDLRGLNRRNSWIAFILCLLLLSTAGIPPLVGFDAKFLIISKLMGSGHIYLAVYLLVMSVIASFYYLKVIKAMYFEEPVLSASVKTSWDMTSVFSLNGLAVLILGIFPSFILSSVLTALI